MKVLVTDRNDKSLYCLDAAEVLHNPRNKEVWFRGYGAGSSEICIPDVRYDEAKGIIEGFFNYSNLDLRHHEAYINEAPPTGDEKYDPDKNVKKYQNESIFKSKFIE